MNTKKKKTNDLICAIYSDGEKQYFTTTTKAAVRYGLVPASVQYSLTHDTKFVIDDRTVTFELVDGSEIPYKYINNN